MNDKERLFRSKSKKIIGGVSGGLGDYLGIDPVIIRVLFVIFAIINGLGILLYIILWIVIPEEPYDETFTVETENGNSNSGESFDNTKNDTARKHEPKSGRGRVIAGVVLIGLGSIFLAERWFPYFDFDDFFPVILIIGGGLLVYNSIKKDRVQQ